MKVSSIKVKLNEKDIFAAIQEYAKVDGFSVDSLTFNDTINIACTLKKGLTIPIKAKIKIDEVYDNVLYLSIVDVNIAKIHIFNGIKNFALKKALKNFGEKGIQIDKDIISVDINVIVSNIPSVKFKLVSLFTKRGMLEAEVQDLEVNKTKEKDEVKEVKVKKEVEKSEPEKKEVKVEEKKPETNVTITKQDSVIVNEEKKKTELSIKTNDKYSTIRCKASKFIPEKYKMFSDYVFVVPDVLILFGRLLKDKRVPLKDKAVISSIIAYFAGPLDIGILFIPFIGEAGAVAIAFYGLSYVMESIPEQVILDNWQGDENFALVVKNGVKLMTKSAKGKNIQKLLIYPQIKEIRAKKKKPRRI